MSSSAYHARTTSSVPVPRPRYTLYGTNLTDASLGARVVFATDEFFAVADNLLARDDPVYDPRAYCAQGKVMDGWESRRRRRPGHDWCVIRLAFAGMVAGVEVDTAYFTGNHAPRVSVQGARAVRYETDEQDEWMPGSLERFERGGGIRGSRADDDAVRRASEACDDEFTWHTLVPTSPLRPGYPESRSHYFAVTDPTLKRHTFTHIRLNLFPDGGVARLKVYGSVSFDCGEFLDKLKSSQPVPLLDLASMAMGGRGLACSNKHFGVPRNLLKPGRGLDMGDGWETARHMDRPAVIATDPQTGLVDTDLGDWCILQLGAATALVERLEIDTRHFKGNYPESILVEAGCARNTNAPIHDETVDHDDVNFDDLTIQWFPLLNRTRLGPDKNFVYELERGDLNPPYVDAPYISHVRVSIYPDGGISRVRVWGRPKRMERGMRRVLSDL